MMRSFIVVTALVLYTALAAAALWRGDSGSTATAADAPRAHTLPAGVSREGLPLRAIGMQIQRVDWLDKYKKSIDEIAAVGADAVKFVVDARQENGQSTKIYLDLRMTPTVEQLAGLIDYAKSKNLRVILMPIVLLDKPIGTEWRGTLKPDLWEDWFDSYREMLRHFCFVAEVHKVDLLVVGSELVSSEHHLDEWTKTIAEVRSIYKGKLTYSSNWDHYTSVPFWNQLDLIGMNSYWSLDNGQKSKATVADMKKRWAAIQKELHSFQKRTGKPLMFLEVGWCSLRNAAHEPWDYTKESEPVDLDLQKRLFQAFFETWYGCPWLGGFSVWEWTPGDGGPDDRGYTPEGKPAESVLKEYFAKPRWELQ